MTAKKKPPRYQWNEIQNAYIFQAMPPRDCEKLPSAIKQGITRQKIKNKAAENGWLEIRHQVQDKIRADTIQKTSDKVSDAISDKLAEIATVTEDQLRALAVAAQTRIFTKGDDGRTVVKDSATILDVQRASQTLLNIQRGLGYIMGVPNTIQLQGDPNNPISVNMIEADKILNELQAEYEKQLSEYKVPKRVDGFVKYIDGISEKQQESFH